MNGIFEEVEEALKLRTTFLTQISIIGWILTFDINGRTTRNHGKCQISKVILCPLKEYWRSSMENGTK